MAEPRLAFSIEDWLSSNTMDAYVHNQRHAVDHLVNKGHITVNKTSVIRLNDRGLLCADEDDVPQETLLNEPCLFQAGADAAVQQQPHALLLDALLEAKPWKSMDAEESYSTVISILDGLPKATHAAWDALADKLRFTTAPNRSKSALRGKLQKACEAETLDWKAFDFFKRACEDGPKLIQWGQTEILLYRLMGVISTFPEELTGDAFIHDADSAERISGLLTLLRVIQRRLSNDSYTLYPMLRRRCQDLERLLKKNKGAPMIRQFIHLFIDQDAGNDRKVNLTHNFKAKCKANHKADRQVNHKADRQVNHKADRQVNRKANRNGDGREDLQT